MACCFRRSFSKRMQPTIATPAISSTAARFLMELSNRLRRSANPIPSSRPRAIASTRLRRVLGITGVSGRPAYCSTTTRTEGSPPFSGVSSSPAMTTNSSDNAFAMSRARSGEASRTLTSISTVSRGDVASTCRARSDGVMSQVKFLDRPLDEHSPASNFVYEATRCWEDRPPMYISYIAPSPSGRGRNEESGGALGSGGVVSSETTSAPRTATASVTAMMIHRVRITRR